MKALFLFILLVGLFGNSVQTISRINRYAREAANAYHEQNYDYAIAAYTYLLEELEVEDDQIRLNLAHAHYKALNLAQAAREYKQLLVGHPSARIRAIAALQLGNVATLQRKHKSALSLYRTALIADPANESARYNYELLRKYLDKYPHLLQEEEEDPLLPEGLPGSAPIPPPPPAPDKEEAPVPKQIPDEQGNSQAEADSQEPSDSGTPSNQNGAGGTSASQQESQLPDSPEKEEPAGQEAGDSLGQDADGTAGNGRRKPGGTETISEEDQRAQTQRARLQQMNLTPEKAQLLLDAMRNAELQYIQQLPRKATRKPDKSKPDW